MISFEKSTNYIGLLTFNYDEEKDFLSENKNIIILPKGVAIPVSKTIDIYPFKNVEQDKVFLILGITQSKAPETDPRFVKKIWSERILLDSKYPVNKPLGLICSLDENEIVSFKIEIFSSCFSKENKATDFDIDKFLVD